MLYKYGKCACEFLNVLFLFQCSFLYFGGVLNKTTILLALVGCEKIIANFVGYLQSHVERALV